MWYVNNSHCFNRLLKCFTPGSTTASDDLSTTIDLSQMSGCDEPHESVVNEVGENPCITVGNGGTCTGDSRHATALVEQPSSRRPQSFPGTRTPKTGPTRANIKTNCYCCCCCCCCSTVTRENEVLRWFCLGVLYTALVLLVRSGRI